MDCLQLSHEQVRALIQHAKTAYPTEACGLLGGHADAVQLLIPITNIAANPQTQYQMSPNELLLAFKSLDAAGLEFMGMYHSHPTSDPIPSQTDIQAAQKQYPGTAQLIISLKNQHPQLKAWRIQPGQVETIELIIGNNAWDKPHPDRLSRPQHAAILLAGLFSLIIMLSISFSLLPPAPILTPVPR